MAGLATVCAAAVAFASCRQVVGVGDQSAAPSTSACGLAYGTPSCASCVQSSCCTESSACEASSPCNAFLSCAGPCKGDPQCRSQCNVDNPVLADPTFAPLSICMASNCATECGLTCGGALLSPPSAATKCQECVASATSGCSTERTCMTSPTYYEFIGCRSTCAAAGDCIHACADANDAGISLSSSFGKITSGPCRSQCDWGQAWSCVGRVAWAAAKSPTVRLTIEVSDYLRGTLFANADVSVCGPQDVDCMTPKAHGTTDVNGRVVLTVPNVPDNAGFGLDGYVQVKSPEIMTWLRYWGFPLSEPQAFFVNDAYQNFAIQVLTPTVYAQYLQSFGATFDPNTGSIVANANDCLGHISPGVQFTTTSSDLATRAYYAFSTTATATDATGIAAIGPIPPGVVDITATPVGLMKPSSVMRGVVVRANAVTAVTMGPTPLP